jgi:uncharacterized protein
MESHAHRTGASQNPDFLTYQRQFTDYLRYPLQNEAMPPDLPPQIGIYARLLFNKIEGSLNACFPIFRQLLDQADWHSLIRSFIKDHSCKSPLYREIPDEFIAYLINEQPTLSIPDFMKNLAHFEWMELVLEATESDPVKARFSRNDNLMTEIPVVNPVLYQLRYAYPVHKIKPSNTSWRDWKNWRNRLHRIKEEPVCLVGLRDKHYTVHFIEVSPATARLIELLQDAILTGEQASLQLAIEMHVADRDPFMNYCRNILDNLKQEQIIVGTTDIR